MFGSIQFLQYIRNLADETVCDTFYPKFGQASVFLVVEMQAYFLSSKMYFKPMQVYGWMDEWMDASKFVITCNSVLRHNPGFVTHRPKNYTYN